MELTNEFNPIREWAKEKGILEHGTIEGQLNKLAEETAELLDAIEHNDKEEQLDAIGDKTVVLTILATMLGFKIEDCINSAYEVIAKRKGKMVNGVFVKEE